MSAIRILLADDHLLFRESLARLLEDDPDFLVVGQVATVRDAIEACLRDEIDIVLLDYDLGDEQGSNLLTELKAHTIQTKVLMVTAGMSDSVTLRVMESGASGIFLKHSSLDDLIAAIHKVAQGEIWMDSQAVRSLVAGKSSREQRARHTQPLTSRQSHVLRAILDGLTNKEIAARLGCSEPSVKATIQELFHKAGVRTRSQLVRIAIENHASDWLQPL
jgi:DNA-binding NarL/FixJ family response regulator